MDTTQTQLDQDTVNLAKAIRQSESGGNFSAKGKSNEVGAYQFTPDTWNAASMKYLKQLVPLDSATPEQQNEVAYKQLKEWKDQGYNVGQIASMWNAGATEPNAYTGKFSNGQASKGVNKHGAAFDVPAYATSVATAYHTLKGGGQVQTDRNNPSAVNQNIQAPPAPPNQIQISNSTEQPTGVFGNSTAGQIGNFLTQNTQELGKHVGLGLAARGNVKNLQNSVDEFQAQSTRMMDAIDKLKSQGKDTSKLMSVFKTYNQHSPQSKDFVSPEMQKELEKGFWQTAKEIGGTAMEASYGKILQGGVNLGKGLLNFAKTGGKALANPLLEEAVGIPAEKFSAMSASEKAFEIEKAVGIQALNPKGAGFTSLLKQAAVELKPLVDKEMGMGSFSTQFPNLAKVGGFLKGASVGLLKNIVPIAGAGAGGAAIAEHFFNKNK